MPISSQKGMDNPGTLCYRISLFQALFHQPQFVNWLLQYHQPQDCVSGREKECLPCWLRLLIVRYWEGGTGSSIDLSKVHPEMSDIFKCCKSSFFLPNIKIAVTDLVKWGG